jgi:hypothetical protein
MGANIAPLLAWLLVALFLVLDFIRDGAEVMWMGGGSSVGEVFLLFREALLSTESESDESEEGSSA